MGLPALVSGLSKIGRRHANIITGAIRTGKTQLDALRTAQKFSVTKLPARWFYRDFEKMTRVTQEWDRMRFTATGRVIRSGYAQSDAILPRNMRTTVEIRFTRAGDNVEKTIAVHVDHDNYMRRGDISDIANDLARDRLKRTSGQIDIRKSIPTMGVRRV